MHITTVNFGLVLHIFNFLEIGGVCRRKLRWWGKTTFTVPDFRPLPQFVSSVLSALNSRLKICVRDWALSFVSEFIDTYLWVTLRPINLLIEIIKIQAKNSYFKKKVKKGEPLLKDPCFLWVVVCWNASVSSGQWLEIMIILYQRYYIQQYDDHCCHYSSSSSSLSSHYNAGLILIKSAKTRSALPRYCQCKKRARWKVSWVQSLERTGYSS